MTWIDNKWIKYLQGYCSGQNQIQDEYVRKVAKNLGLGAPINIEFIWQQQIISKFNSADDQGVIILTGTAGDGKTKLCRDIVRQIDQAAFDEDDWNSKSYFSSSIRTIVKDFSELRQDETKLVIEELLQVLETGSTTKPILIAVNDGILLQELDSFIEKPTQDDKAHLAKQLKEIIEDKINLGFSNCDKEELINLINLSKLNAKENFGLILSSLIQHEGWNGCNNCEGKINGICPIYNKYTLLRDNDNIRENLSNIILLLQLNNEHFTIRELLNLATNTLLATTPKAKHLKIGESEIYNAIYSCKRVEKLSANPNAHIDSSIEVGFWGMNIGPHKMNNARPYAEINKLMFGELSTNYWDNYLKNIEQRKVAIPLGTRADLFDSHRTKVSQDSAKFRGAALRRARIQLYCYQDKDDRAYHLQKFNSFGYYQSKLYETLITQDECNDIDTIAMLILALNRVFHGRFVAAGTAADRLFIPEKDQGSITPISIFHGDEIRDRVISIRKITDDLKLTGARVEPMLVFEVARGVELKLALTVELFDFLFQVTKGAPPNTTNPRLYKKLLIFRSKLATAVSENSRQGAKRIETYAIKTGDFRPQVLKVNNG